MDPHFVLLLLICFLRCGLLFLPVSSTFTYNSYQNNQLVYQNCENNGNLSRSPSIISTLLEELMENSNKSKYFATYAGDDEISILGLFQCRVDMSNHDCHNCVQNLPKLSKNLCGTRIPARIQLSGCYIHYQIDQIRTWTSRLQLLHKICSRTKSRSRKLLESRDAAFSAVLDQECYSNTGTPSCDVIHESLRVVAECEGNLRGCDCIECVKKAVEIAQDECGYSVSGEIFLDSCYLSYDGIYQGTYILFFIYILFIATYINTYLF